MTAPNRWLTFHCGLPKTGSTFLQANVFPRPLVGTYVPGKLPFAHVIDPLALATGPVLVSDERLTWTPLERADAKRLKREMMLAYIADLWPGSNLLLFLREPSEMIRSHYAQYLHDGGFRTFEDFCAHHFHPEAFRFELMLDAIARMPWGRVLLIDHRDLYEHPERTKTLIQNFTGMRFSGGKRPYRDGRRNISVSGFGASLLRRSNAFMLRGYPAHGLGLPEKVLRRRRAVRRLVQPGPLRFLNAIGPELAPDETLAGLRHAFRESWEEVRGRIVESQHNVRCETRH